MKSRIRLLLVFVCFTTASAAFAIVQPTTCPYVPPTIDGAFSPFEWDSATTLDIQVNLPEGGVAPGRIYVMNDDKFLYVALRIKRSVPDPASSFFIGLDANDDAYVSAGDDVFGISHSSPEGDLAFDDVLWSGGTCRPGGLCTSDDTNRGGTNDVIAAFGFDGAYMTYELSKQLMIDDPNDAALSPQSTIAMRFSLRLLGPNVLADTFYPTYPNGRHGLTVLISDCGPVPF